MADSPEELAARLAALERAVEALGEEIAELRARTVSAAAAQPQRKVPRSPEAAGRPPIIDAPPDFANELRSRAARLGAVATDDSPPQFSDSRSPPAADLETLVGRYGMLGLATLLALAAVGTFLSWAISHGLLGPTARVVLGSILAAALAAWGLRLRRRERWFGDSLLGLSLAVAHLCSWAAGPSLHLVPTPVALAVCAAASVALAAFALTEGDEPLWCVGFGGAAIAPFVTSTGQGTAPMLAAYGIAALVAGGSPLGPRRWIVAGRVYAAAAALFTFALLAMPREQHGSLFALALPLVVAAAGVLPFAAGDVLRARLRTVGILAGVVASCLEYTMAERDHAALAIALAAGVWLALLDRAEDGSAGALRDGWGSLPAEACDWIDGAVLPFLFLAALRQALPHRPDIAGAALGIAAVLHLWLASRRNEGALRDALAAAAWGSAIASTTVVVHWTSSPAAGAAAVAWVSVLAALVGRAVPSRTWRWAPFASLAFASVWSLELVTWRPRYESLPFTTSASATAVAIAVAWVVALQLSETRRAWPGAAVFAFLWVHQELAYAVSPAVSTLLLVTWYAVSSVVAVGAGRSRGSAPLRHVGLGLAVVASAIAVHAGFQLDAVAARIAACAVASGFLLGIAWWYRRPNDEAAAPDPSP